MQNDSEKKVVELNLDDVLPNRFQPRIKFDEESINELAMSIKKYGVIQPIVVRKIGEKYEIIAGERRYKASVIAGRQTIPAIVYDLSDNDSVEIALLENVQREDLTPIEKAISYKKILDMGYINQEDLAQKIGKSQSSVANTLRLLNLAEEAQEALLEKKISERHARSLLKIKDEKQQVNMLNRIINERLTVRKTDEEIEKMFNEEGNNAGVVNIPDLSTPANNTNNTYNMPGFMNIDNIENNAQDIVKAEKPAADLGSLLTPSSTDYKPVDDELQSGKFFNLFDDNSSQQSVNNYTAPAEPVMPEFNFNQPSYTAPTEPAMPEFNFNQPSYTAPAEPVMPEFNFNQPSYASPVDPKNDGSDSDSQKTIQNTNTNFGIQTPEMPSAEPTMPEFNFNQPSYTAPVEPVMPEFNFDQPSYTTPVEPVMPEFNFDQPSYTAPVEPVMPEFNFNQPSYTAPVEPKNDGSDSDSQKTIQYANTNFGVQTPEMPSTEPVMPEFNFNQPSYTAPTEPVMPEFNFDQPSYTAPTEPAMPELNFDEPSLGTPVMPEPTPAVNNATTGDEHHGFFGLFGRKKDVTEAPTSNTNQNETSYTAPAEPVMPAFNAEQPSVQGSPVSNIRVAIDAIRNCEMNLQNMGFTVDVDEVDMGGTYQVIFRINK